MSAPSIAVTLVNGTTVANPIWGVPSDELNCYIDTLRFSAKPQSIQSLQNHQGVDIVDAYLPTEVELSMSAEVTTSSGTGAPSIAMSTAFTPVNTLAYFGLGAVTLVFRLQSGDVSFSRSGYAKMDAMFKAKPGVN